MLTWARNYVKIIFESRRSNSVHCLCMQRKVHKLCILQQYEWVAINNNKVPIKNLCSCMREKLQTESPSYQMVGLLLSRHWKNWNQNVDGFTYSITFALNRVDFKNWLVKTWPRSKVLAAAGYISYHLASMSACVGHLEVIAFLWEGIFILSPYALMVDRYYFFWRPRDCCVWIYYHRYMLWLHFAAQASRSNI